MNRRAVVMAGLIACGAALGRCESPAPAAPRPVAEMRGESGPRPGPLGESLVLGSPAGLEARVWVVMDEGGAVDAALDAADAAPALGDQRVLDDWARAGMRLSIVPVDRFEDFQRALSPRGLINRQWLGQSGRWMVAAAGPAMEGRGLVTVDDGVVSLGPGRLRILVRDWAAPTTEGPRLRLEIAAQHKSNEGARVYAQTASLDEMDEGLALSGLTAGLALDGSVVVVITPLDAVAAGLAGEEEEAQLDAASAGPSPRRPPTAGEAMLAGPGGERGERLKTIVALVGKPPEVYRLLQGGGDPVVTGGGSPAASR